MTNTTEISSPSKSLRPFMTVWVGQLFSILGSQLVQFAIIWHLTQQTGSATVLAIASIVGLLPQVVLGPFVGPLVDRWSRKWTLIISDLVVTLTTILLAVLFWSGVIETWHIFAVLFVRSLGGAFHGPAMIASTSLMVPQEHLTRIQGLNQMLNGGLSIVAAPLGALLITLLPIESVLMIDVVTAAIAISTIFFVHIPQPQKQTTVAGEQTSYFTELREGLRYMLNWRGLLMLAGMATLVNMVLGPTFSFIPLLVTDHFSGTAWHLGWLQASFGIGILAGGVLLGVWGGFRRRIRTTLVGLAGLGIGVLIVGLTPAPLFFLAIFGMLFTGIMSSLCNGPIMAIFQATVAPSMQGRVFTLMGSVTAGMSPLGLALAGPIADVIGVRAWFLLGGVVTMMMALIASFAPSIIHIEEQRDDHVEAVEAVPAMPVMTSAEL